MDKTLKQQESNKEIHLSLPNKEWFTLKEACTLKGLNIKSAYNQRRLMPNHGLYEGKIGGRLCFRRNTIITWLTKSDEQLIID